MGSGNVRECELLNLQTQKPCSLDQFPNIGTTHCYTAAGTFKSSNAPEKIYTAFARGCINCTGFNSSRLPFLIFINSWFVQSLEFVKKAWNLSNNFPNLEKVCNIDISSGKIVCLFVCFFFSQLQEVPYDWIFFVGQIFSNLARMFAAHYECFVPAFLRFLLITYLITLSLGKKSLFWKKSQGKVEFWIQKPVLSLLTEQTVSVISIQRPLSTHTKWGRLFS